MRYDDDYEEHETRREHHRDGGARDLVQDGMQRTADAFANARVGETKKVFGFEIDSGIADWLSSMYNLGADFVSQKVEPKAQEYARKFGAKAGLKGSKLDTAAAVAAIGTTAVIKTAKNFEDMGRSLLGQRKERTDLARTLAPVLDDVKGAHSMWALYSVSQKDNEVIFAHRKRLSKISNATNIGNVVDLFISSGSNLALDGKRFKQMWIDRSNPAAQTAILSAPQSAKAIEDASQTSLGRMALSGSAPQLASHLKKSSFYRLQKSLQPYSALEMILELGEQVATSPDARAFQVPKSYQSPHGHREQFGLEKYIEEIFIQHQKDMADISPVHTEIRQALRDDLAKVAKPIAEAIRKGDMSAMSLVRMVGEGKIILKNGRGIAGVEVVKDLIKREAPKQSSYANDDPAEYYKDASFNRSQLKKMLGKLDGEEKLAFVSMFSDNILIDAGMSKKEVQALRESTAKTADRIRAELVVGLNAEDKLKTEVLAESEAERVAQASEAIMDTGVGAMKKLKTSPANENGIERLLANAVVNKPEYLGKMLKTGHELMEKAAANDDQMADRPTHTERLSSRLQDKHGAEAGNDDMYLGAANGR